MSTIFGMKAQRSLVHAIFGPFGGMNFHKTQIRPVSFTLSIGPLRALFSIVDKTRSQSIGPSFRIAALLCAGLLNTALLAQNKNTDHLQQHWLQYAGEFRFNEKWSTTLEGSFRSIDTDPHASQVLVRLSAGYRFHANWKLSLGMADIVGWRSGILFRNELRPHQELLHNKQFGRCSLEERLRIEERFYHSPETTISEQSEQFNMRYRLRVLFKVELFNLGAPERALVLDLGNEVFLKSGTQTSGRWFDQDRILIGASVQFNKDLSASLHYVAQLVGAVNSNAVRREDIFWVTIRQLINVPLRDPR